MLDMANCNVALQLQNALAFQVGSGVRFFHLLLANAENRIESSICTIIAGTLDYYRIKYDCRFIFNELNKLSYMARSRAFDEFNPRQPFNEEPRFKDTVWKFTESNYFEIVSGVVDSIRSTPYVSKSVADATELVINEIVSNVLDHSFDEATGNEACGFIMVQQYARKNKRNRLFGYDYYLDFSVFDYGQGLAETIRRAGYQPRTAADAIKIALNKGVTENSNRGAGNGLWMLTRLTKACKGHLEISTGNQKLRRSYYDGKKKEQILASSTCLRQNRKGSTLVSFAIGYEKAIDFLSVFGYKPVHLWTEEREYGAQSLTIRVAEDSKGTGTRSAARNFSWLLINLENIYFIRLDFEGVDVVSNAYARTLLESLLDHCDIRDFQIKYEFLNMTKAVELVMFNAFTTVLDLRHKHLMRL